MIIQEGKYIIFPFALLRCIIRKNETLELYPLYVGVREQQKTGRRLGEDLLLFSRFYLITLVHLKFCFVQVLEEE